MDVDGTLVATDLLHEAALQFVAQYPLRLYCLPLWLRQGKATLKTRLADHVEPGIDTVPLRPEVLRLIREAQAAGRAGVPRLGLRSPLRQRAGRADRRDRRRVRDRAGPATSPGAAKAEQLVASFGAQGYDYIGDMPVDVPVWHSARAGARGRA